MTDLMRAAQQALEAMRCAVPTGKITLYEWDKAVSDLDAALAEPPVDDPHRDHWVAIAEAAQKIAASKECGLMEAKALCAALDRLTDAALAEPVQEPEPGEYHGWVLREVLFDNGEPVGHREPVQEPVQEPFALPCPTPTACKAHCCSGHCVPRTNHPNHMAALAEPQEPDSPARRCGGPGCDGTCCQPVQEPQGCAHCNHPLYAAVKCRVCGRAHGIGGEHE